jgi:alpha-tubulin suppressor-like RCC1 family protein
VKTLAAFLVRRLFASAEAGGRRAAFFCLILSLLGCSGKNPVDELVPEADVEPKVVSFSTVTLSVNEGGAAASFNLLLDKAYTTDTLVTISVVGGTGRIQSLAGTYTIPANTRELPVSVQVIEDTIYQNDQVAIASLSSTEKGVKADPTQPSLSITMVDNDPMPALSVADVSVNENSGIMTFTVVQDRPSLFASTFSWATANGTATAGSDYTAASGSGLIFSGTLTTTFSVALTGDSNYETNETLLVNLSNPGDTNTIADAQGVGTILNDDPVPKVAFSVSSQSVNESTATATVTVSLNATSYQDITVPFSVNASSTATGGGVDYSLSSSGPLLISAGQTTASFTVAINNDVLDENNETVIFNLGTPTNATVGAISSQTLTIVDNDPMPTVQWSAASQSNSESVSTVTVTANLSAASGRSVSVPFTIGAGSTATAGAGADYTYSPSSPLSITAGSTSASITFTINNDSIYEGDETIIVNMGTPTNATASATLVHTITIENDDTAPTLSIADVSQAEGNGSGTSAFTFTVTSSAVSELPITFNYSTSDGTATVADGDYTAATAVAATISAGSTTTTFIVNGTTDDKYEVDEYFNVTLSGGSGYTVAGSQLTAKGTMTNDDVVPIVAAGSGHMCGIRDGAIHCWGENADGQLGDSSNINRASPTSTGIASGATDIIAGAKFSCAVVSGAAKCWGLNEFGQLGDNSKTSRNAPVTVSGLTSGVTSIAAGKDHACAVVNGGVQCWGSDLHGQLGQNLLGSGSTTIMSDNFDDNARDTSLWDLGSLFGFTSSGVNINEVSNELEMSVPANTANVAGGYISKKYYDFTGGSVTVRPINLPGNTEEEQFHLSVGFEGSYLYTIYYYKNKVRFRYVIGNTVSSTSLNYNSNQHQYFRISHDASTDTINFQTSGDGVTWTTQRSVARNIKITSVRVGLSVYTAVANPSPTTVTVDDFSLQLASTNRLTPVSVTGLTSGVSKVTAGAYHTCALLTDGSARCWGDNQYGQLGNGSNTDSGSAVTPTSLTANVTAIAAADLHTCAVVNGAAKCWGRNQTGQVGDGTTTDRNSPTAVSTLGSGVADIMTGGLSFQNSMVGAHSCALLTTGALQCWGSNLQGQLGRNATTTVVGESFNDSVQNTGLWNIGVGNLTADGLIAVSQANHQLDFTLVNGDATPRYSGYMSVNTYDLTGRQWICDLASTLAKESTGAEMSCSIYIDANNEAAIRLYQGNLYFTSKVAGSSTQTSVTFDQTTMRYVRIRHLIAGDAIEMETSPDALTWTSQRSFVRSLTITTVNVQATVGTSASTETSVYSGSPSFAHLYLQSAADQSLVPVAVNGVTSGGLTLSRGGGANACVFMANSLSCWGSNAFQQVGDNTFVDRYTPVVVSGF